MADGRLTYSNQYFNDVADDMLLNKQQIRQGPILLREGDSVSPLSFGTYFMICDGSNYGYARFSVFCKVENNPHFPYKHVPHRSDNFTLVRPNKSDTEAIFDGLNPIKGDLWT